MFSLPNSLNGMCILYVVYRKGLFVVVKILARMCRIKSYKHVNDTNRVLLIDLLTTFNLSIQSDFRSRQMP